MKVRKGEKVAKTLEEEKEKRIFKMKEKLEIHLAIATLFLLPTTLLFTIGLFLPSETMKPYRALWASALFFGLVFTAFFVFLATATNKRLEQLKMEKC